MPIRAEARVERGEEGCRFCGSAPLHPFVDLGHSPLANSYLEEGDLVRPEALYPLRAAVCPACFLVQLGEEETPQEIFSRYAYYSSYSSSWLDHAARYAAQACERFQLGSGSLVVEVGSNDGYLLRYFLEAGIPALGIEPAANVAEAARASGVDTLVRFFDEALARELRGAGRQADLIVANNVLAHIPDTNGTMAAFRTLLKPGGRLSVEVPSLLSLMEENQFDTIYHEHYSYYSLGTLDQIFAAHMLPLVDAEPLPTHGGSLRLLASPAEAGHPGPGRRLQELLAREEAAGLRSLARYDQFAGQVRRAKEEILLFLKKRREEGARVAAYGAPAKGNTLLNYCGIGPELIAYTVDRNPHKQGHYLPGSRLPVHAPEYIYGDRPDYLVILPWNLREEIAAQMADIRHWGGRFVVFIPRVEVF